VMVLRSYIWKEGIMYVNLRLLGTLIGEYSLENYIYTGAEDPVWMALAIP
jgi:hypothetical protein